MKKVLALFLIAVFMLAILPTAFAYVGSKSVYAYSTTSVRTWGNISCDYSGYFCSGTSFSGSGDVTKVTVRPKTTGGVNAANATTFSASALSGGKDYFSSDYATVDLWANTDVYNFGGSITGYWKF